MPVTLSTRQEPAETDVHAAIPARPTFLLIGAAKAGTTTVSDILREHPQVCGPRNGSKEVHYFDERYETHSPEWYFSQFSANIAVGEFTPSYLYLTECRDRIHDTLGDNIRFIVALRNPVDRAFAHYCHAINHWWEPKYRPLGYPIEDLNFEDAIAQEAERLASGEFHIRHLSYYSKGLYANQLQWYFQRFPRESFFIYTLDEFISNPHAVLRRLCEFVEVDADVTFTRPDRRLNAQTNRTMDPATRVALTCRYAPSIRQLEDLLGRDFSTWLPAL